MRSSASPITTRSWALLFRWSELGSKTACDEHSPLSNAIECCACSRQNLAHNRSTAGRCSASANRVTFSVPACSAAREKMTSQAQPHDAHRRRDDSWLGTKLHQRSLRCSGFGVMAQEQGLAAPLLDGNGNDPGVFVTPAARRQGGLVRYSFGTGLPFWPVSPINESRIPTPS